MVHHTAESLKELQAELGLCVLWTEEISFWDNTAGNPLCPLHKPASAVGHLPLGKTIPVL